MSFRERGIKKGIKGCVWVDFGSLNGRVWEFLRGSLGRVWEF